MEEQKLQELSIYVLRELARRSGVSSPTSKKKDQLISEIIAITEGRQQPMLNSKQGRPPKGFAYNISNVFPEEATKSLNFCQEEHEFVNDNMVSALGYVQILENNVAFVLIQEDNYHFKKCFIPATVVLSNNLKNGDKVVVEIVKEENQTVVKQVFNVNGYPSLKRETNRVNYEEISHVLPFKKVEFTNKQLNSFNILFGENVYLYGSNNNQNTISSVEYLNSCNADVKLYLNMSVAEKNKIFLNNLCNAEMFVSSFTDETEYAREIATLAIERAKRAMEEGSNVVVVVDDILSLISIEKLEAMITKQLVSLTKASKKGSVSVVVVVPNESNISFIEKLADKRIKLENSNFIM